MDAVNQHVHVSDIDGIYLYVCNRKRCEGGTIKLAGRIRAKCRCYVYDVYVMRLHCQSVYLQMRKEGSSVRKVYIYQENICFNYLHEVVTSIEFCPHNPTRF